MPAAGSTIKSDARRQAVVEAAIACFARKGFYGTTTHEIAERAGISQPYVYRLFEDKQALFAQAVTHVGDLLTSALSVKVAVGDDTGTTASAALQAAYGSLIEDRDVLRFLMHANCAVDEPVIREAVLECYARQVELVTELLGGDERAVRAWFASGMLDNVVVALGLIELDAPWAQTLSGR